MASLKFFLKHPNSKDESIINLIFQYGYYEIDQTSGRKKYKFLKMSSKEKINPKYWNQAKCRARETQSFPQYPEFNTRLENLENTIYNVYRRLINDDGIQPTPAKLKKEITNEIIMNSGQVIGNSNNINFFDFIRTIIENSDKGVRLTPKGKQYSKHTVRAYVFTLNHLIEFQKHRGERIDFDVIDLDFYNDLVNWFYSQNKAKNTVGNQIKNLKVFMSEAFDQEVTKNIAFKNKKFKVLEEETDTIYLSDDELERMLALDLSKKPSLEIARDNFLLDCYLGLRIADFKKIKKDHIIEIQGIKMISIKMQKTENPVKIPLHKNAIKILEKYNYEIKTHTDQAMNKKIKEIGKLAEIDEEVSATLTRAGKLVTTSYKKYEKITNHTARRSFATNLFYAGVPTLSIMKMTGHKTENSFLKYIKVNEEENALITAQHPYFAQ